jgi:hypothetical protein
VRAVYIREPDPGEHGPTAERNGCRVMIGPMAKHRAKHPNDRSVRLAGIWEQAEEGGIRQQWTVIVRTKQRPRRSNTF